MYENLFHALYASLFTGALLSPIVTATSATPSCRYLPGDEAWPTADTWAAFNTSVGGRVTATVPLAAPCHQSQFGVYNETACEVLKETWTFPEAHYNSSSSVMAPFFANRSCDPWTTKDGNCAIGTYVSYSVNVSTAEHIQKTLSFAKRNNIRFVIRNTGHDYNGKSTGAGAIAVWTHHLKDIEIMQYKSKHYSGPAMKMGAGVQGFEAYAVAHEHDLIVVGGECDSVGLAGGYTQGGGHSAVGSKFGMGADQALEWELVDGMGRHITATRDINSDVFWALSGGGGGTYGVVISMTVKAHPEMPTTGANLTFTSEGVSQDGYWDAISAYHATLPAVVDEGIMAVSFFSNASFSISPLTAPGVSVERVNELLLPLTSKLEDHGITYTKFVKQYASYFEHYNTMFPPLQEPWQVGIAQYGGRLIPRSSVEEKNAEVTEAYRQITNKGGEVTIVAINVSSEVSGDVYNAVNPRWRQTLLDTVLTTPWNFTAPWSEMEANADLMTEELIPILANFTPGGGTYLNEGDFQDPHWKQNYYGVNYDQLSKVKDKYDPDHIFYAITAVGSDYWKPQADGRLCRAA